MKYDVFISYRRESGTHQAKALRAVLENLGYSVFIDTRKMGSGDFTKKLDEKIRESCNFVVVISKDCFPHKKEGTDYFLYEIALALKLGKNVIPVYYDGMSYESIQKFLLGIEDFNKQNYIIYHDDADEGSDNQLVSYLKTEKEVLNDRFISLSKERATVRKELVLIEKNKVNPKCPVCGASHSVAMTYCNTCGYKFFDGLEKLAVDPIEQLQEDERLEKHKEIWLNSRSDEIITELKQQLEETKDSMHESELEHKQQEKKLKDQLQESETKRKELEGQCVNLEKQLEVLKMQVNASVIGQDSLEIPVNDKVSFKMIRIEGGTFLMGAQKTEPSGPNYDDKAWDDESPVHKVTLSSFYIGEVMVTQALWKAVMGSEPTENGGWENQYGKGANHPSYRVSYNEIVKDFLPKLTQMTGKNFRLPTEAEWEYAARGGNMRNGYKYAGSNTIDDVAWYDGNSEDKTHAVKTKSPNELGIYDMSGNVWEWCQDWYGSYGSDSQTNPTGSSNGSRRVRRGGSWYFNARYCRVSYRSYSDPDSWDYRIGFRLVLPLKPLQKDLKQRRRRLSMAGPQGTKRPSHA